jgi:hypothetical protein
MDTLAQPRPPSSRAGPESHFFISYCRDDFEYVERLINHLQRFDVPLWLDKRMEWGVQRFPQEIHRRLTSSLAVIVIMSPKSEISRWVELEVLEGQRHDRDFFPILLAGERFFLLASTNYFDARDGGLPSEREIRQLQNIRDAHMRGAGKAPPVILPPPAQRPPTRMVHDSGDDSMRKLRSFLADGEIEHADILTTSLLLEAVGRLGNGWMRRADGKKVPFDLLAGIDSVWSTFSHGSQGFWAQLALHPSPPLGVPAGNYRDFTMLQLALGWKATLRDTTPRYGTFVKPSGYPTWFFPTLRNPQLERFDGWHDPWWTTVMAVHLQLRRWRGKA